MTTIDTKRVSNRRAVGFATLAELSAEAERIARAEQVGRAHALGNWSPGQNLQHLARFMTCSIDGFGSEPPIPVKLLGRSMRLFLGKKIFLNPPPAGFRLPRGLPFEPAERVGATEAAAELRAVIERVEAGASFIPGSPVLGRLSRGQWIELHLRHAELHLSFVGIGADGR